MIASVVATLTEDAGRLTSTIEVIVARPNVDLGEYDAASRKLPLTIESDSRLGVEETTRWLQDLPGVSFVDVVLVHFEATDHQPVSPRQTIRESCFPELHNRKKEWR